MPASIAATKITALPWPAPSATSAGPGQIPGQPPADGARHHERERRVPHPCQIEKAEHLGRVGHAGNDQPDAEHEAGEQCGEQGHGDSSY